MKRILLNKGLSTIVDDKDYAELVQYNWHVIMIDRIQYAERKEGKKNIRIHRQIMNPTKTNVVDHINGNGLDNRRSNLRICTPNQNRCNVHAKDSTKTSIYLGVCWDKRDEIWKAQIQKNGKKINLGNYKAEREAAIAYNLAARVLFGKFANINKIEMSELREASREEVLI